MSIVLRDWLPFEIVCYDDSATDIFEDDEALGSGSGATHALTGFNLTQTRWVYIQRVAYYMNPTNAVTYQLYLLSDSEDGALTEPTLVIYDSTAARADSTIYIETGMNSSQLPVLKRLAHGNTIYFKIDWSAAPGNTTGTVNVTGWAR